MLVLTRRPGEKIKIGNNIVVSILEIEGGYIKLGVEAPKDISILRMEVFEKIQKENIESASKDIRDIADAAALIKKKFSRSK